MLYLAATVAFWSPALVLLVLAGVSRVRGRIPPLGVWVAASVWPLLACSVRPDLTILWKLSLVCVSGLGWTMALVRLHRLQRPPWRGALRWLGASGLVLTTGLVGLLFLGDPALGVASLGV